MAYKFQLIDLKRSPAKNISGVCVDSDDFLQVANEAQERLMNRGNFWDTEWLIRLCISSGCITWPKYVGTVLGVRFCDGSSSEIRNNWFAILGQYQAYTSGINGFFPSTNIVISDIGTAPCYNEISGTTGKLIRYYVTKNADIGKKITLYGTKYGGQPLQEVDANGNWIDGLTLTAAAPYVSTAIYVTKITSVVREATQGNARLYEYDVTGNILRDLAIYDPDETNPRYRRSVINNFCNLALAKDANGLEKTQVAALVKLAFVPLKNDRDFLLIDNMTAMKFAIQAIKLEEANDDVAAEIKMAKAVKELNFEQRNREPSQQTTVRVDSLNGCGVYSPV